MKSLSLRSRYFLETVRGESSLKYCSPLKHENSVNAQKLNLALFCSISTESYEVVYFMFKSFNSYRISSKGCPPSDEWRETLYSRSYVRHTVTKFKQSVLHCLIFLSQETQAQWKENDVKYRQLQEKHKSFNGRLEKLRQEKVRIFRTVLRNFTSKFYFMIFIDYRVNNKTTKYFSISL